MKTKYLLSWGLVLISLTSVFVVTTNLLNISVAQTTQSIKINSNKEDRNDQIHLEQIKTDKPPFSEAEIKQRVANLRQIVPHKPTLLSDSDKVRIMTEAAETKTPEALSLLIGCLAYNFSSALSNDGGFAQSALIPAIGLIRRHYGETAGKILYREMLMTEDERLRERIVLTIQSILSISIIAELNKQYENQISSTFQGVTFIQMLEKENLKVKMVCYEEIPKPQSTKNLTAFKRIGGIYCDENENENLNILNRPARNDN